LYTTHSNYYFSAYLKAGDFIALDMTKDGSWDHCAFIVSSDNYLTNGYYDYLVAQHTSDYLAWATDDTNSWETYDGNSTYAVIRP